MILQGTRVGTYLFWLVLAISVPLLLLTGVTVWRVERVQQQQQELALVDQAREADQPIERAFERIENGLLTLAGSNALLAGQLDSFGDEMLRLADRLDGVAITLTAPDGTSILRVGQPSPQATAVDQDPVRQAAHQAIQAGKSVVTNLLAPDDPAHRAIAIAVPVFRPGQDRPVLALAGVLTSTTLAGLAKQIPALPDSLIVTVRDRNGVTVSRFPYADDRIGDPEPPGFREAIAGRTTGLISIAAPLDGKQVIRGFSVGRISGYSVSAALTLDAYGAAIHRNLIQIIIVGLLLLMAGLFAAAYLARRLVIGLQAAERGDPATTRSGLREVDELTSRLQAASADRETAEAALRSSEAQLRDMIGTLDLAAIMARELHGTIWFWSHGCEQIYGWTREEAVGRSSHDLLRTQFPVPLPDIERALLTQGEWKGDLVHRRRDGTVIIAAAHKALKRDLNGQPHMVMESLVDVTALRQAQDALRILNQDLEQRVRNEVAAREVAQQRAAHADRIQALGQLAGGIAHDFNNVLQAVAGGAALIARRPKDAEGVERLVKVIHDAAARGASITRRMLLLARRGDLRAEPVTVEPMLDGMREVFVHTLGAAIDVRVEVTAGLPRLLADKAQLETALVNLATNARDAMPDGGSLRLKAACEVIGPDGKQDLAGLAPGVYVRLSVIDDGAGMTAATLAKVGEPFFTTKDVGKGTGLGLSMVKGFAEQSGGSFQIESAISTGTTATLWLPSVPGDVMPVPEEVADRQRRQTGRILLVDDDPLVRDTLMAQLEELGHQVLAASGGTNALAMLRAREAVDLMITDLSMPGMNGLALIKEARGLRPSLPAILLTGYAGDAAALAAGDAPRESYVLVRKPASSAVLNERVAALLERA